MLLLKETIVRLVLNSVLKFTSVILFKRACQWTHMRISFLAMKVRYLMSLE